MAETIPGSSPDAIERAATALTGGGVVAVPTETVYGVAAVPDEAGLARLIEVKRRSTDKGIALMVDSLDQVRQLAEVPPAAEALAGRYWPGPLTLVLPQLAGRPLSPLLTGGRPTIGFRLPDHDVPRQLARRLGPVALSSANVSGQPDATTAEHVATSLGAEIELIVDDGPVRGGVPSTVVACSADGDVEVLRVGAIPEAEVRAAARK